MRLPRLGIYTHVRVCNSCCAAEAKALKEGNSGGLANSHSAGAKQADHSKRKIMSALRKRDYSVGDLEKSEGAEERYDIIVNGEALALASVLREVQNWKALGRVDSQKWNFEACPLDDFGKSLDDLFRAYLRWSQKDADREANRFNVSKVMRRLEKLSTWGFENRAILQGQASMPAQQKERVWRAWGLCVSEKEDAHGRVILCLNMDFIDREYIRSSATIVEDSCRVFWWLIHGLAFDEAAQRSGVILVENVATAGFFDSFSLVPADLKAKLEKLTLGSSAIKLKQFCFVHQPFWVRAIVRFMSLFLSRKMRQRFVLYGNDRGKMFRDLGGPDALPAAFVEGATGSNRDRLMKKAFYPETTEADSSKEETTLVL